MAGMLALASVGQAFGASKETIRMMQQLDDLQQQVKDLQKTVDTQTAILKTLVEQANDNVNSMKAAIAELQRTNQQNLATTANRLDGVTTQIQELSASLDETKARLAKLSDQVSQTQNILQTLNSSGQPAASNTGQAGRGGNGNRVVPDPTTLYQSALSYYNGGQYDLAIQAFEEFLQNYPDSDYASNAQFYIGDCYYNQKRYEQAIEAYNTCIERYPKGNKLPAAQLKKGYALLALGQKQAGIKELRSLIQRFPDSDEANLARGRLRQLSAPARRRSE
jgi:tol-pal system protein YbgF